MIPDSGSLGSPPESNSCLGSRSQKDRVPIRGKGSEDRGVSGRRFGGLEG